MKAISRRTVIKGLIASSGAISCLATSLRPNYRSVANQTIGPGFFKFSFSAPKYLDVITLIGIEPDQQVMFVCLQGLVNKYSPSIYVLEDDQEGRLTWLNNLGIPHRFWSSPWEMLKNYLSFIKGSIVYDPNLIDTLNVATTLASFYGLVVASPALAAVLASQYGIAPKIDLTNKFKDKISLYSWAINGVFRNCPDNLLFSIAPAVVAGEPPIIEQAFFGQYFPEIMPPEIPSPLMPNAFLRDLVTATSGKCFSLDISNEKEMVLFQNLLNSSKSLSSFLGWFQKGSYGGEDEGVSLCSSNNIPVFASDYFCNSTVFMGVPATISPQPSSPMVSLQNKLYLTFTFTEGDNLQYIEHQMRLNWDNPNRGIVPTNWSISPMLINFAPFMASYYFSTKSANDYFVCGPSGMGYVYPNLLGANQLGAYLKATSLYLSQLNITALMVYSRLMGNLIPLSSQVGSMYESILAPGGILLDWGINQSISKIGTQTPTITGELVSSADGLIYLINQLQATYKPGAPAFASIGLESFSLSPSDLVKASSHINYNTVEVLMADQFFALLKQYLGL